MDKNRISKIAYRLGTAKIMPISIQAAIVDACFNRCVMCDHPLREQFYINGDDWCIFLEDAHKIGLRSVCYSGGDPFAYRHMNQVMEKHIDLNLDFGILTSGYLPKSIDINLLKSSKWVRVSLDTVSPEKYKEIRGLISIQKVFDSIDRMLDHGIEIGLSPTLHNDNRNHIIDVLKYAIEKNIYVDVKTAYPGTYPIDKVDWGIFEEYKNKLKLRLYTGDYEKFNKCSAVKLQLFIDSKGDVYPCCTLGGDVLANSLMSPFGNIKDDWNVIAEKILNFSNLPKEFRSSGCHICQGRFTEINHIAEIIDTNGVFF